MLLHPQPRSTAAQTSACIWWTWKYKNWTRRREARCYRSIDIRGEVTRREVYHFIFVGARRSQLPRVHPVSQTDSNLTSSGGIVYIVLIFSTPCTSCVSPRATKHARSQRAPDAYCIKYAFCSIAILTCTVVFGLWLMRAAIVVVKSHSASIILAFCSETLFITSTIRIVV